MSCPARLQDCVQLSTENTTSTLDVISALVRTEVLPVLPMQAQNQAPTTLVPGVQCPTSNAEPAAT